MRSTLGLIFVVACLSNAWAADAVPEAGAAPEAAAAETVDLAALAKQRLARVGDREINALEFQRAMEFQAQVAESGTGEPPVVDREFRARAMASLLDRNLLEMMAESAGIKVPDLEVKAEVAKRKRLFLNEAAFEAYLNRLGYSEAQMYEEVQQGLVAERFVERKTAHVAVTQDAVLQEYQRLRTAGQLDRKERSADLRHILLRAANESPGSWEDAEGRIQAVHARVVAGEAFDAVAKEVSEDFMSMEQGGLYEEATQAMVLPEFATRLFTQPPGEVSEPFKSRMGWHILKIETVNEPGVVPFEKVRTRIERTLAAPLRQEAVRALLEQARRIYRVELYPATEPAS